MKTQKHYQNHQQQQKRQTSFHKQKIQQTKQEISLSINEQKYNKIQSPTKLFGFLSNRNKSSIKTSVKNISNFFYRNEQNQIEKNPIKQFQQIQTIKCPIQKPTSVRKINLYISNHKHVKINNDNGKQILENSFINSVEETKSKNSNQKIKQSSYRKINSLTKKYHTKRAKITLIDLPKHYEQLNNNSISYSNCLCISKQLARSQRKYCSNSTTPSKKRQKSKINITLNKNYKSTQNLKELQENTHDLSKQTNRQLKFSLINNNSIEQTNFAQPKIKNNNSKTPFFDFQ